MPPSFRLRILSAPRDPERFPDGDDALGESVFGMLCTALEKGLPRPAMLVVHPDKVEQFDMVPLLEAYPDDRERMMAAIAGQPEVACAVVAGVLRVRVGLLPEPGRAVAVFIEWPDNRWWTCWQLLDSSGALRADEPLVRKAVDGWPRPGGVGGWFSTARRHGLRLRVDRPGEQEGLGLVH